MRIFFSIISFLIILSSCQKKYEDSNDPNIETIVNNYKAAKEAADKVFLMAMEDAEPPVPKWKIKAAYNAVKVFGRWSIIPRAPEYLSGKD